MRHVLILCSALGLICSTSSAQVWQSLNGGLKHSPVAMTELEKTVAVAYKVGSTDGATQFGISVWNGTIWIHLPGIMCDSGTRINTLKWYKDELYIGGQFNRFNTISNARSLVKYSNRTYKNVPNISTNSVKFFETVIDLNIYNNLLVVAGQFSSTEVKNSANLGFFNGEKWVESGIKELESVNGAVLSSIGSGDHFYIGGAFTKVGGTRTKYLAHFEKGELKPFTYNYARPYHLVSYNKGIVAVGTINSNETPMYFFAVDGDTAVKIMEGLDKVTYVSDIVSAGDVLYASGIFKFSTDQTVYSIVKYENGKWEPLNVGQLATVNDLLFHNNVLFASGEFTDYRGISLNHVARLSMQNIEKKFAILSGTVYHDKDDNCMINGRDERLNKNIIRIEPGNRVIRPNINGIYKIYLEEGKYNITITPAEFWGPSTCSKLTQTVELKAGDVKRDVDFPMVQQSNIRDLKVKLSASSGPRVIAANLQQYYINYENLGSNELVEGIVKLAFDDDLEKMIASPAPQKVEGDTAYWNVNDLSPGERGVIKCLFKVKQDADEFIELTADIVQNETEENDDNNSSSLTQRVMPEDDDVRKFVNPETTWSDTAFINPDAESITYQISFANYTSDTVRTVYVIDTVDLNNTIQEILDVSWSHNVVPTTIEGPKYSDYAILVYKFPNINLPPNPTKNGEIVDDEGHIAFTMKMSGNLQIGATYTNRARVLFDDEFDEMTNEVMALVEEEASVLPVASNEPILVYPNPTEGDITIDLNVQNQSDYVVTSMTGEQVLSGTLQPNHKIDLTDLSPSIYFISITSETGLFTARVIKQ